MGEMLTLALLFPSRSSLFCDVTLAPAGQEAVCQHAIEPIVATPVGKHRDKENFLNTAGA
jgi:hypothetical protein